LSCRHGTKDGEVTAALAPSIADSRLLIQPAEQPDEQDDRQGNADEPEKETASHVILQKMFRSLT
jgi:hypothetical protein